MNAPHTDHTDQFIVDALRKAGGLSLSLVAECGDDILGHVALSPVMISDGSTGWYGLGPVSVVPRRQRQGIGNRLIESAMNWLREQGAAGCVVLGDPAYYARFGFKVEPAVILPGVPVEYFQALAFPSEMPSGNVTYHEAFNARA